MKAYTCKINGSLFIVLTSSGLKKPTAHAHLKSSVGLYIMYIEDMLWSFDRGIRFCAVYKKENRTPSLYKIQILRACAAIKE